MLPDKNWKSDSVLRLLLAIFGTWSIGILIAAILGKLFPGISDNKSGLLNMIIITLAFHCAALVWIHFFLRGENMSWTEAFGFLSGKKSRLIGLALLAAILVLPVAWGLQQLSGRVLLAFHRKAEFQQVIQELQKPDVSILQQVYLGFMALIAAPIVEETIFRGIIYPAIKHAGHPKIALWGTSILFSLTHQNATAFLSLVFLAMILTLLYEETGNLVTSMLAHSFFNAANLIMLLLSKHFLTS